MSAAPLPGNEQARLQALMRYDILDSEPEPDFDEITRMASYICGTPISVMSLIDAERQWFKARTGIDDSETPREDAFCAHTILQPGMMVVKDALQDERFFDNPLVTGSPRIRFYAGMPLVTSDGFALGSLCAIDQVPRELSPEQLQALETLGRQVIKNMELRRSHRQLRELAQRLERLNAGKDRLFSVVSHDLKSPFSGVLGLLEMLTEDVGNMSKEEIHRDLLMLSKSAGETFNLIENLLQWSTFESGETPFRPTANLVDDVVRSVIALLQGAADRKSIRLTAMPNPEATVLADKSMVHSVIQNLAANAIKFTEAGGEVSIASRVDGKWIEVFVTDTGIGMSAGRLKKLLAREDEDASTYGTAGERGTGLGLGLCRSFVEKHGGEFSASSVEGKGSTFRFTLPRAA